MVLFCLTPDPFLASRRSFRTRDVIFLMLPVTAQTWATFRRRLRARPDAGGVCHLSSAVASYRVEVRGRGSHAVLCVHAHGGDRQGGKEAAIGLRGAL